MKKDTILIVDDEPNVLKAVARLLRSDKYEIFTAASGAGALDLMEAHPASLIISDQRMPGMSGVELLQDIRKRYPDTIRIILTGSTGIEHAVGAINRGEVYRYILKPWHDEDFRLTVQRALERYHILEQNKRLTKEIERQNRALKEVNAHLEERVNERTRELTESYLSTVFVLAAAVEVKDPYTRGHSELVSRYASLIAREMGLSQKDKETVQVAGLLHDVGKIAIDERVLLKPAPLTDEERRLIEAHPKKAVSILERAKLPWDVIPIIKHHHEHYDGSGYPCRLKGKEIPSGARILAVADTFDAMNSQRPYREAYPKEIIVSELEQGSGSQFDPQVAASFLRVIRRDSQTIFERDRMASITFTDYLKNRI
ncbi:MAG: hypothetical protein AMS15_06160 [Planctomycetes bacterium DG_23]|nr:MAG: hypothetical protein AMS15_06160 [Planctomycetes bacterium DG_23]